MRKLLSRTACTIQSFTFNKICNGAEWEYMCTLNPVNGTWSVTRRKISDPRIPPFMQILCGDGHGQTRLFFPVIGCDRPTTRFSDPEDLVRYIEENYENQGVTEG